MTLISLRWDDGLRGCCFFLSLLTSSFPFWVRNPLDALLLRDWRVPFLRRHIHHSDVCDIDGSHTNLSGLLWYMFITLVWLVHWRSKVTESVDDASYVDIEFIFLDHGGKLGLLFQSSYSGPCTLSTFCTRFEGLKGFNPQLLFYRQGVKGLLFLLLLLVGSFPLATRSSSSLISTIALDVTSLKVAHEYLVSFL